MHFFIRHQIWHTSRPIYYEQIWILTHMRLWRPFWKMTAKGPIRDGSTSKSLHNILVYLCAKFGAFMTKCTIGLISCSTNGKQGCLMYQIVVYKHFFKFYNKDSNYIRQVSYLGDIVQNIWFGCPSFIIAQLKMPDFWIWSRAFWYTNGIIKSRTLFVISCFHKA